MVKPVSAAPVQDVASLGLLPKVDSYNCEALELTADTANQVVVAAPGANKQIWVYGMSLTADTGAGTVQFTDEDDNAVTGAMAFSDEGGIQKPLSGHFAMPYWKLATNKALHADTATASAAGDIQYAIVDVS